uniref:Gypsy retrotransposon integrase-like protein 1 n=1 Tax=Xiphophorus maculatus TaxID=8083 RepID=A0A3B5R5T0_XIPMA
MCVCVRIVHVLLLYERIGEYSPYSLCFMSGGVQQRDNCGKEIKLFAPTALHSYLLKYYHDHPTARHLGIAKTLARLRLRYFWPNMNSDVKKYVVSCCSCQTTKPTQRKPAGLMVPIQPQRPWEYRGVDYIGPLPCTQRRNAYILVFVDYFSKWIEVSAVREATAQVAANKFITDIFARHGSPSYLISDRGTPFISELFEHVSGPAKSTPVTLNGGDSVILFFGSGAVVCCPALALNFLQNVHLETTFLTTWRALTIQYLSLVCTKVSRIPACIIFSC